MANKSPAHFPFRNVGWALAPALIFNSDRRNETAGHSVGCLHRIDFGAECARGFFAGRPVEGKPGPCVEVEPLFKSGSASALAKYSTNE
jgi:hypothetical protein